MRSRIAGLIPAEGTVRFDGADIGRLSTRERVRRGIVYVPEGRQIVVTLTVAEKKFHTDTKKKKKNRFGPVELQDPARVKQRTAI